MIDSEEENIFYSSVLQDFAHPILNAKDSLEMYTTKLKIAEMIWNYCIAKEFKLPVFDILHAAITHQNKSCPEMIPAFNQFVEMKNEEYNEFKRYFVKVEVRTSKDGANTVYAETIHPLNFNKI